MTDSPALAHDLWFGDSAATLAPVPGGRVEQPNAPVQAGWTGTEGPAIEQASWPRSPVSGEPMMHVLSMWLPPQYRRRGADLPGIAFFAGDGQFAEEEAIGAPDSDDPFLRQLAEARPHPTFRLMTDIIDGQWGLLWLTEQELAGRTAPPADVRRAGEHLATTHEGANAWDSAVPTTLLWQSVRADPNAGLVPSETDGEGGYQTPWDREARATRPWAENLPGCHLGGTTFCVQGLPEGLTPWYLELEEFGDVNFGGGNAQIDLESDTFDWAQ